MARLTHFLMASDWRAAAIASGLLFLPILSWLGPSIVALFALRRGIEKTLIVSGVPLVVSIGLALGAGDSATTIVLVVTVILAVVLNRTSNWLSVLQVSYFISLILVCIVGAFYGETLRELVTAIKTVIMASTEFSTLGLNETTLDAWMSSLSTGALSFVYMVSAFCALIFARIMQAQAFNPGGFKAEFERILLPRTFACLCLATVILGFVVNPWMLRITPVAALPLIFAGIALVHGLTTRCDSKGLLLTFYIALLFFTPYLLALLAFLAALDAFVDFRTRSRTEPSIDED